MYTVVVGGNRCVIHSDEASGAPRAIDRDTPHAWHRWQERGTRLRQIERERERVRERNRKRKRK